METFCHYQELRAACFNVNQDVAGSIGNHLGDARRARQAERAIDQGRPRRIEVSQFRTWGITHAGLRDEPYSRHRVGYALPSLAITGPGCARNALHGRVTGVQDPLCVQAGVPRRQP